MRRAPLAAEPLEDRATPTAQGLFAIGAGFGGPPRVQVYETATGLLVGDFLAYEPTFAGGVNAAVADVNNDGFADVIVGAGVGGGPRVRVLDGQAFRTLISPNPPAPRDGTSFIQDQFVIADFFAFEATQRGGTFVTGGNHGGAAFADLVVGAGPGGGPRVRIFDGQKIAEQRRNFTGNLPDDSIANFFAFESSFRNGVTVSSSPTLFGGAFSDLVVAPGFGGGPRVRVLNGLDIGTERLNYTSFGVNDGLADFFAADPNLRTGLFVTFADYNSDGIADVAVGTGPGVRAAVTVYSGSQIRQQGGTFTGIRAGDVLDAFNVGPNGYTNGVTVGSAVLGGGAFQGGLLHGFGGQGVIGEWVLSKYATGSGFLVRQPVYDFLFDANFVGGVFVSN